MFKKKRNFLLRKRPKLSLPEGLSSYRRGNFSVAKKQSNLSLLKFPSDILSPPISYFFRYKFLMLVVRISVCKKKLKEKKSDLDFFQSVSGCDKRGEEGGEGNNLKLYETRLYNRHKNGIRLIETYPSVVTLLRFDVLLLFRSFNCQSGTHLLPKKDIQLTNEASKK